MPMRSVICVDRATFCSKLFVNADHSFVRTKLGNTYHNYGAHTCVHRDTTDMELVFPVSVWYYNKI